MMNESNRKYANCPYCGRQLFKAVGKCSVEITCGRCKKELVWAWDGIFMRISEKSHDEDYDDPDGDRYSAERSTLHSQRKAI